MRHPTLLDGLHLGVEPRSEVIGPTLLRYDLAAETVDRFFNDLRQPDWRQRLQARADLPTRAGLPLVDQPTHRKAVILVADAACLTPGFPRLDPAKVDSAGLVIRREDGGATDIWATDREGDPLGWFTAPPEALPADATFEPDAARRRAVLTGKNPALKLKPAVTGDAGGISETTHPLFPIPPDIAQTIGRTLYFTILPTTSLAVRPVSAPPAPFGLADVGSRVPGILQSDRRGLTLPPTATTVAPAQARTSADDGVRALMSALTWLGQEAGMFTGEDYAGPLRAALAGIAIEGPSQANLRDWFDAAHAILVEGRTGTAITTPDAWPAISANAFAQIRQAGFDAMSARWGRLSPSVTRFGPVGEHYHVRCFLRIDDHPGCPPRILWSPLSRSYTIRPWYESAGAPPAQIELPPLTAESLHNIRPDVAVKVPPEIQKFMDRLNINNLLDGKADSNLSIKFGMICGFSIPIITICAFIILQIFLSLLNILFFWLPYVKICIPFPIVESEESDGGGG